MTMPKQIQRVRDMVLAMLPGVRVVLTPQEEAFAPHLRGNAPLHEALKAFITSRINARASQPVPTEPIDCRGSMERDHELRWLLSRLDFIYRSPVHTPAANDGEPPA